MALVKIDDDICVVNVDSNWVQQLRITNNTLDNGAMLIIDGLKEFLDSQCEAVQLNEASCKKLFLSIKKIIDNASEYDSIREALMSGVISVKNMDKEKIKKELQTQRETQRREKKEQERILKEQKEQERREQREERAKIIEKQKMLNFSEVTKTPEQQKKESGVEIIRIKARPIEEMREYCKTHTVPEIMEKYKFSAPAPCKNFLKYHKMTWVSQSTGRPRSYDVKKMKELAATMTLTELSKVYNVTVPTMKRTLDRYEVVCMKCRKRG